MLLSIKAEVVCLDLSPFPIIFKFVTIIPFVQQELILFHCMWRWSSQQLMLKQIHIVTFERSTNGIKCPILPPEFAKKIKRAWHKTTFKTRQVNTSRRRILCVPLYICCQVTRSSKVNSDRNLSVTMVSFFLPAFLSFPFFRLVEYNYIYIERKRIIIT